MKVHKLAERARALVRRARARTWVPAVLFLAVTVRADIITDIENAIIGFFESIWSGISSFFGTIFQAIANTFATIFNAPAAAITASFKSLQDWAAQYGPLAPVITMGIVAVVLIMATFLIWLIIKVSTSEGEQTLGEVEEGE